MTDTMNAAPLANRGLRPVQELGRDRPHGDRLRYMAGCKCDPCRKANSAYESERQRARKTGDWNGFVSAQPARMHMRKLAKAGVGRRAVQAATDVADSILSKIISGERTQIRARTSRKILAVTKAAASDHACIDAKPTWALIAELLDEGYTVAFLAQRLGYKKPTLQFGKKHCTARNAYDVARLHRELTT